MNMSLDMKYWHARFFFQIEYLDTRANLCKNIFYPATIKNDNGAIETREKFVQSEQNQQLHQLKNKGKKGE